jgi:hypothetical protein
MDKRRRNRVLWMLIALTCLVCAVAAPGLAQEGTAVSSGHVTMHIGRGAMLISVTGGRGVLTFQGREYPFSMGGMGFGLLGVTAVDAEGEVYNMKSVEDFPGAYAQGSADWTAGSGQGVLWLTNTKGVSMKLHSSTKGVSLAVGGEGLVIRMGGGKPTDSRP